MFCKNCGTSLPDGSVICHSCGASLQAQPAQQPQSPYTAQQPQAGNQPLQNPYYNPQSGYSQPQNGQPQYSQPQYAPPQYAPPQYAQPQYGQPQYIQSQPMKKTNGLAVASFVLALVGMITCFSLFIPIIITPLALIFGIVALVQCNREPMYTSKGFAIAGIVISALMVFFGLIVLLITLI